MANPGPLALSTEEAATFEPTFEIIPGGLAPGAERSQSRVYRGDTLVFKAHMENIPSAYLTMGGRVAGESTPKTELAPDSATWRVVVGAMGTPGKLGQPADDVDATPTIQLGPPLAHAGQTFQKTYQFHVLADMAWLSGQCATAGGKLNSAFLGLSSMVDQAYLNYDEAYQRHKAAVDNNGKRKQLESDVLTGILLAGIGGAAGGTVADLLKGDQGVAIATATGDITKYIIRLGGLHTPGGTGTQGSDTPDPASSAGSSKAAGMSPERWKGMKEKECIDAAKAGQDAANDLKKQIDEAWAQGKTELMDLDPVELVQPTVDSLSKMVEVKSTHDYAVELWRTWIRTYGITAKENWAGGKTRTDELAGHTAFTDSKLYDDIHDQIGNDLDAEIQALRAETAPDPLTELPD